MTIVMFPKIQDDTLVAYFLLTRFGKDKFPGIENAPLEFWTELPANKSASDLEKEGYLLMDMGGGTLDHHRLGEFNKKLCCSDLVARTLGIAGRPELQKMLQWARRSDLEGKGTISRDLIDRAFGLAGLLTALNKTYPGQSLKVLNMSLPLIEAHYQQEFQKYQEFPKEYEMALENGTAKEFNATQYGKQLKIIFIESGNPSLAGFLRAKIGGDLIVQKAPTGHVNFIANQKSGLQLHKLARTIKLLEAEANEIILNIGDLKELELPGRTDGLPHWYYDTRANTLQNGGVNPQKIPPTKLSIEDIELAVKQSLNLSREQDKFHQSTRRSHGAIIID